MRKANVTGLLVSGVIAFGGACGPPYVVEDTDNFRPDVVDCEDALAKLSTCCPGFDTTKVACRYYYWSDVHQDSCSGQETGSIRFTEPALEEPDSQCILHSSCSDLVSHGVCQRAQAAEPPTDEASSPPEVCP